VILLQSDAEDRHRFGDRPRAHPEDGLKRLITGAA